MPSASFGHAPPAAAKEKRRGKTSDAAFPLDAARKLFAPARPPERRAAYVNRRRRDASGNAAPLDATSARGGKSRGEKAGATAKRTTTTKKRRRGVNRGRHGSECG